MKTLKPGQPHQRRCVDGRGMRREAVQGLLPAAAGADVMGRFDPVDVACYLAGAAASCVVNRWLYLDPMAVPRPDRRTAIA